MRPKIIFLVVCAPLLVFLLLGCAATATTSRTSTADVRKTQSPQPAGEDGQFTERQKWSLARQAYSQAAAEEKKKNNEAAAYYYEVALELLGSLDMASIEIPTHRVLAFQRKVLQSYDHFLASVDNLPSTAGPVAILDQTAPESADSLDSEDIDATGADRDSKPVPIIAHPNALPGVPVSMNGDVAGQINFFMNKGRKVMLKWMERSAYMFPRLRPILREEGVPEDLVFLAMIESGLNPKAYSYAHAAGVWQFIASTGRIYGLNVDRVYDERLHIESSTRAAARYLRKLYEEFGDWYLAMAAYNCGEMRIERELNRLGRNRDFWSIQHRLPRQTRAYVPAYLATRAVCSNPAQYGFPPLPSEIQFSCEHVELNGCFRLDDVARAAGVDPVLVSEMNPEFLRGVTRSNGPCKVRIPTPADKAFDARLASMPAVNIPATAVHKVRKGETLASIARQYGTTSDAIRRLPENRKLSSRLRTGQKITIPMDGMASRNAGTVAASANPSQSKAESGKPQGELATARGAGHEIIYTVHRGESLGKISRQLGVSVSEICRQNNIKNPNLVQPGKKLTIRVPGGEAEDVAQSARKAAPDTAAAVNPVQEPAGQASADSKETAQRQLASANSVEQAAPHVQTPVATSLKASRLEPQTHTVQPGDTVWSIARIYGKDPHKIMNWNRLTRDSRIYPGQELIINQ